MNDSDFIFYRSSEGMNKGVLVPNSGLFKIFITY